MYRFSTLYSKLENIESRLLKVAEELDAENFKLKETLSQLYEHNKQREYENRHSTD